MSDNSQTLAVETTNTTWKLEAIKDNFDQARLNYYDFHVVGLGSGSFSCLSEQLDGNGVECLPLESLVWNGKQIDLGGFIEKNVYFEQGELAGLNLWGQDWEIIGNLGIKINGINAAGKINY